MSGRRRFAALLVALLAGLFALVAVAPSSQAKPGYTKGATISFNTSGSCGHLTVSGTGFAPREQVVITLHSKTFTLATVTTDASGNFSVAVTLPAGVTGNHQIVATGATGDSDNGHLTLSACGNGAAGQGAGSGGLSTTGVAVLSLGGLGLVLLIGGVFLVVSGRRRRTLV
jgi:hypothetical protein